MGKYFILGQISALNYYMETIKPRRMDIKNTYIKTILYIASEQARLNKMLADGEMRYKVWNGGQR